MFQGYNDDDEDARTFTPSTLMSCGEIKKNTEQKTKPKKEKTGKYKHLDLSTASNWKE